MIETILTFSSKIWRRNLETNDGYWEISKHKQRLLLSTCHLPIFLVTLKVETNVGWNVSIIFSTKSIAILLGKKCISESVSSAEKFRESVMSKGITFFCSFGQRNSFFLFFNFQVRIFLVKDTHLSLRRSPPFFKKWQIGFWFAWQEWRISWKHFQRVKQHLRDVWKFIRNCDIFLGALLTSKLANYRPLLTRGRRNFFLS